MNQEELLKQIEKRLSTVHLDPKMENVGVVYSVGDGIIQATGLSKVGFGEEVEFQDGSRGLSFNLNEDYTSIILLSDSIKIKEGDTIKTTGRILGITGSDDRNRNGEKVPMIRRFPPLFPQRGVKAPLIFN